MGCGVSRDDHSFDTSHSYQHTSPSPSPSPQRSNVSVTLGGAGTTILPDDDEDNNAGGSDTNVRQGLQASASVHSGDGASTTLCEERARTVTSSLVPEETVSMPRRSEPPPFVTTKARGSSTATAGDTLVPVPLPQLGGLDAQRRDTSCVVDALGPGALRYEADVGSSSSLGTNPAAIKAAMHIGSSSKRPPPTSDVPSGQLSAAITTTAVVSRHCVPSILAPAADLQQMASLNSEDIVGGAGQPTSTTTVSTTASGASSSPLTARPDPHFCNADYFRPTSRSRELGVGGTSPVPPLGGATLQARPPLHRVLSHGALECRSQQTLTSSFDAGSKQQTQQQAPHAASQVDRSSTTDLSAAGILRVLGGEEEDGNTLGVGGPLAPSCNTSSRHHYQRLHYHQQPHLRGSRSAIDASSMAAGGEDDLSITTMRDITLARSQQQQQQQPNASYQPLQLLSAKSDAASLFSGSLHALPSVSSATDSEHNGTPKSLEGCSTILDE